MKTKKIEITIVKVVPEWKYKLLIARMDKQDKMISQLRKDVDELTDAFRRFTRLYCI